MPPLTDISPEVLRHHHQLSPKQINKLFEGEIVQESLEEKAVRLIKVAEFIRITDSLRTKDIKFISLKGPLLSQRLYGDPAQRQYYDHDILVDVRDISSSIKTLTEIGYQPIWHTWPHKKSGQRIIVNHVHHLSFQHLQTDLNVELHWRLFQTPSVKFSTIEDLVNENQIDLQLEHRSFKVLSNELELLYLAMHGSIHYWRRLKWLVDINEFVITQSINWELFKDLVDKLHAGRLVALANSVLSVYFPGSPLMKYEGSVIPFMRDFSLKQIEEVDQKDHESISEKLKRWQFSLATYPDLSYRVKRFWNFILFYTYQFIRHR